MLGCVLISLQAEDSGNFTVRNGSLLTEQYFDLQVLALAVLPRLV
jgi:hypothetical protein